MAALEGTPAETLPAPAAPAALAAPAAPAELEESWLAGSSKPFRILVIDDHFPICKLYERELTKEGFEVSICSEGRKAMETLREKSPDLVILDIHIPGFNGLQLLSEVLEIDPELPVILCTAYSSYRDSFLSWPADAFLVKSADLSELKTNIQSILRQRRMRTAG